MPFRVAVDRGVGSRARCGLTLIVVLFLVSPLASVNAQDCGDRWGDVNRDGSVDIIDAYDVARYSAGLSISDTDFSNTLADVNADGGVNVLDAQNIALYSVGREAAPRIGETVDERLSLETGEHAIFPSAVCLVVPSGEDSVSYLVGIQWVSTEPEELVPISVTGGSAPSAKKEEARPSVSYRAAPPEGRPFPLPDAGAFPDRIQSVVRRHSTATLTRAARSAENDTVNHEPWKEGDTVDIRFPCGENDVGCSGDVKFVDHLVTSVQERVALLLQVDSKADLDTDSLIQLADWIDRNVYPTFDDYFGPVTDVDENGRVGIVMNDEVSGGFVASRDFLPMEEHEVSNEAEIAYVGTADELDLASGQLYDFLLANVAHELAHVFQLHRVHGRGLSWLPPWLSEGGASLGSELVGLRATELSPRGNYDQAEQRAADDAIRGSWFGVVGTGHYQYFGYSLTDPGSRFEGAPHRCTWLVADVSGDLDGCDGSLNYTVGAAFLRWLSDHFGPEFGGEDHLHRELLQTPGSDREIVSNLVGVSFDTLVAQWASSLYLDDRGFPTDSLTQLLTWNMDDILRNGFTEDDNRLQPSVHGFGGFQKDYRVRAASSAYLLVRGVPKEGFPIEMDSSQAGALDDIQLWVVRLR